MSYNTPVRLLQGGSTQEVGPSGTISIVSGGSIQVASGAIINVASGGTLNVAGAFQVGGTAGRFAFGTAGLASGVGTIATGLTTIVSVSANVISGVQGGAGSMSSAVYDDSLRASGSAIFRGLAGTLAFTGNNGTIAWIAFGN